MAGCVAVGRPDRSCSAEARKPSGPRAAIETLPAVFPSREVEIAAPWSNERFGRIGVEVTKSAGGLRASFRARRSPTRPINLGRYAADDIVTAAVASACGLDDLISGALPHKSTWLLRSPSLLAAPLPATVGLGRQVSGQALFRATTAALGMPGERSEAEWQRYREAACGRFRPAGPASSPPAKPPKFANVRRKRSPHERMSRSDFVTAEIVRELSRDRLQRISKVVENTSISPIFSETHDYSVGVFYADDRGVSLVARAQSVPVHIFAALTSVETILEAYRGDVHEGDLFLACDPYYGGSHVRTGPWSTRSSSRASRGSSRRSVAMSTTSVAARRAATTRWRGRSGRRISRSPGAAASRGEQVDEFESHPLQHPHEGRHHRRPQRDGRRLHRRGTRLREIVSKYGPQRFSAASTTS